MTTSDTIGRVARPRKVLSETTLVRIQAARGYRDRAEEGWRRIVVDALGEGSFSAVSEATGLSKDTLQRWKREAGR